MDSGEITLENGHLDLQLISKDLYVEFKTLNDDINQLGLSNIFTLKETKLYLNLDKLSKSCNHVIHSYRDNLKMLDSMSDRNKYLDSQVQRLEKLLQRNKQDNDSVDSENYRLKDTIKKLEKQIENISIQLKTEKTNKRVSDSNNEREKTSLKSEKHKLEKELENLKDRMAKLISNPKKQYSSIEIVNDPKNVLEPVYDTSGRRGTFCVEQDPGVLDRILLKNTKLHLNDLLLENRELRDLLVMYLTDLEQLTGANIELTPTYSLQRNNSSSSIDSNGSLKSNQTFVLPVTDDKENITENPNNKLLREMPYHLIKDNIKERYMRNLDNLKDILKEEKDEVIRHVIRRRSVIGPTKSEEITNQENMSRLQKEIFHLRKKVSDYEELIQGKEDLIEMAIEQRIRRGSLLPVEQK